MSSQYSSEPPHMEPEIKRLDGVVREVALPPLVAPMTHGSLADIPFDNETAAPHEAALSRKGPDGEWTDVTAAEFAAQVQAVAKGLIAEGLVPGDRIAIMARTTYEWTLLDFAAWAAGLVTVPVYPTSSPFQVRWILQDSGAVALATETVAQAAALGPERDRIPDLRHMWVFEKGHVERLAELGQNVPDSEVAVRRGVLGPDTLATLIYTSGTTGRPKGCAITHGNFFAEIDNAIELLYPIFRARTQDEPSMLLFLPLSHVFGRMVAVACLRARVKLGHSPSLQTQDLLADLASFKPTFLLAIPYVPRRSSTRAARPPSGCAAARPSTARRASHSGTARRWRPASTAQGLDRARACAPPARSTTRWSTAVSATPSAAGSVTRSAAAPRSAAAAAFYAGAGIDVYEGYGLTESTAAATVTPPNKPRLGTVGWPLPGTRVRIAADGEILLSGAQVFRGYWDPHAGGVVDASPDGWFATGDIGELDDGGYLSITGRKKEILITAGGKNVAPAPMEDWLRAHPLIAHVMILGDRRPYVTALITLDPDGITHWRQMNGKHPVPAELLVDDPELLAILQRAIDEANKLVSRPESIRRFTVLPGAFTEYAGQLTPTMKLKRDEIARDFSREIEGLYADYEQQ